MMLFTDSVPRIMNTEATLSRPLTSIALKGGMFTLTSILLLDTDLENLSEQLDDKINQAPNFFLHAPIIIDVSRLRQQDAKLSFPELIAMMRAKRLIPIGVRGASKSVKEAAIAAGLALFPEEKIVAKKQPVIENKPPETLTTAPVTIRAEPLGNSPTRVITQPIRSGQQLYVPGGDLIILAAVSHGAEVLADGNIHVHGPLRGRALAGIMGDQEAMIYCKSLEAELVSIAGQYRICDDLKETCWKQATCIQLEQGRLNIRAI
ncbi:MAG TPA: septum site-determining protein MinC [Candidatus Berkiella sp.]|nr:septum site-determining protein MinC [Candidatus Berkiella sp.]